MDDNYFGCIKRFLKNKLFQTLMVNQVKITILKNIWSYKTFGEFPPKKEYLVEFKILQIQKIHNFFG
jgi:hypothetical protein